MSTDDQQGDLAEKLAGPVMTLRIILLAMAGGVVFFAVASVVMNAGREPNPDGEWILLTWMALAAAPVAVVASRLIPAVVAGSARGQIAARRRDPAPATSGPQTILPELGDAGALYTVYHTKTIIGAALLEGAAFFSIVAFFIEGTWIALGVGMGLAVVILSMFPSASRVAEWIQQQLRRIDEEQLLGN